MEFFFFPTYICGFRVHTGFSRFAQPSTFPRPSVETFLCEMWSLNISHFTPLWKNDLGQVHGVHECWPVRYTKQFLWFCLSREHNVEPFAVVEKIYIIFTYICVNLNQIRRCYFVVVVHVFFTGSGTAIEVRTNIKIQRTKSHNGKMDHLMWKNWFQNQKIWHVYVL